MFRKTKVAESTCSFCSKHWSAVKVIAGPGIMICAECVERCEITPECDGGEQVTTGLTQVPRGQGGFSLWFFPKLRAKQRVEPTCSFCGTTGPDLVQPPSTLGTHALICSRCLALCRDIIAEAVER